MKCHSTPLEGAFLLEPTRHQDDRGWFMERYNLKIFQELGITQPFVQDNHSFSLPGVLRGLHKQEAPDQGKLVGVIRGRIWDVAVDARPSSPSFGKHVGVVLDAESPHFFWIPPGMLHGFCVLGDEPAEVIYKVDAPFTPSGERGVRWDDPQLAIAWPITNPILSDKDKHLPGWESMLP